MKLVRMLVPLLLLLAPSATRADLPPFDVGSAAQLFVDRTLVYDAKGVAFTLHRARKHPANPILKADQPWEGWRLEIDGSVLYDEDEKIFKMWYLCEPGPNNDYFDHDNPTCYATSKDGLRISLLPNVAAAGEPSCSNCGRRPGSPGRLPLACRVSFQLRLDRPDG